MNWSLEKYTGTKSRHTCPACGRKRCFTLYINEDGEQLNPSVGRCDHEQPAVTTTHPHSPSKTTRKPKTTGGTTL